MTSPQVSEGFAGFYRSRASSLQLVEQYFRFLKVLQEFSGSEPTNKGNDLKNERLETKGNTSSWFSLCHRFLKVLVIGGEKGYLFYPLIGQVSGDYKQFFPQVTTGS
jgi:hypothetical protein